MKPGTIYGRVSSADRRDVEIDDELEQLNAELGLKVMVCANGAHFPGVVVHVDGRYIVRCESVVNEDETDLVVVRRRRP